ncbi:MAG: OmpA family protein [bacterium]
MKIKFLMIFQSLILLCMNFSYAQPDKSRTYNAGFFFQYGINLHIADFKKLTGIPNCCPNFEDGIGTGYTIGMLFEKYLSNDISFGIRASFATFNGEMIKYEPTFVIVDSLYRNGEFKHVMAGEFANIGVEPLINYSPIPDLYIHAGIRGSFQLIKDYEQYEQITKPLKEGTFADTSGNTYSRFRNVNNGEIPNASDFLLYGVLGISYNLPVNKEKTLTLSPEIFFYYGLNSNVSDVPWYVNSLRAGLALKYSPKSRIEVIETIENFDTVFIENEFITQNILRQGKVTVSEKEELVDDVYNITRIVTRIDTFYIQKKFNLSATITAVGVDSTGNEIQNPKIIIEEFVSIRYQPLLNYIFFDENSSELKNSYVKLNSNQIDSFDLQNLHKKETLETYFEILNIVGQRMKMYPNANLKIVGCNADIGNEKANLKLSNDRAATVYKYFTDVWGIEQGRLKLESRNIPSKPSTPLDMPDKTAENRRVELYSDIPEILEPINTTDIELFAKPSMLRFFPTVNSDAGVKSWTVSAYQDFPENMMNFISSGNEDIPKYIDWSISQNQNDIPKHHLPIKFYLKVEDKKGNIENTKTDSIPVELITIQKKRFEKLGDKIIERYSLVLFDFDDATIKDNNITIVEFIRTSISPNSNITISGYSDRTGEDSYNKALSLKRAISAKVAIGRNDAKIFGIGEESLLYNNDLPEGRFYCRTVNILVETPIK